MEKETLNIIIALCTLMVTVATLVFTVKNIKGYLHRKIDQKQEQIRRIEHKEALKYGPNGRYPRVITRDDERKERLQNEISELERKL